MKFSRSWQRSPSLFARVCYFGCLKGGDGSIVGAHESALTGALTQLGLVCDLGPWAGFGPTTIERARTTDPKAEKTALFQTLSTANAAALERRAMQVIVGDYTYMRTYICTCDCMCIDTLFSRGRQCRLATSLLEGFRRNRIEARLI